MNAHTAVLPAAVRRRWDAIAISQLVARATELEDENHELRQRAAWAEDRADMWERTAEAEREGRTLGLMQSGQIVQIDRPITTIDDDPEYRS